MACQVLAAVLAFVQLWLHPLLCRVNSRATIIAGNHLHALSHSERRAKHLLRFPVKATRLTDMWRCKHTLLCVAEGRRPLNGGIQLPELRLEVRGNAGSG